MGLWIILYVKATEWIELIHSSFPGGKKKRFFLVIYAKVKTTLIYFFFLELQCKYIVLVK